LLNDFLREEHLNTIDDEQDENVAFVFKFINSLMFIKLSE
jgi:hypothetical protein